MRNRWLPLALLAAIAVIALYMRRPLLNTTTQPPLRSSSDSTASREAPAGEPSAERRHGARNRAATAPGTFDFYLLNLSWSPEFCATHTSAPECAAHPRFVLHGLWPQNTDGTYPEHCSSAPGPSDPGSFSDILPDRGLLTHEWQTHGTCSGLDPDAYFALARRAAQAVAIPASLQRLSAPASRTTASILADFEGSNPAVPAASFALSCGNNDLSAVEVCFSKALSPVPCSGVRSCRASVVRITPPGGSLP